MRALKLLTALFSAAILLPGCGIKGALQHPPQVAVDVPFSTASLPNDHSNKTPSSPGNKAV